MGVGYALGNKNKKQADEEEILVLGEDDPDVITFSKSTTISLYSYAEKKYTNLKIPYKIKVEACKKFNKPIIILNYHFISFL